MIRQLQPEDIMAIKDNLVEVRDIWRGISFEDAKKMVAVGQAVSYVKSEKVVACCGVVKKGNVWEIWAIYSSIASRLERARAAVVFRKELYKWKESHSEKVMFAIPSDLDNGKRYGDFLGAIFRGVKQSQLFSGVINNMYEVL